MGVATTFASGGQRDRRRKPAHGRQSLVMVPATVSVRALPRVEPVKRQGSVLRPSPMSEGLDHEVCGLNLLSGCANQCTFCYARAYPGYPGDQTVLFYGNSAGQLRAELRERRRLPHAVYLCPSTDPVPPFGAVQEEACRVMEVLADYGVETWFMTRGFIRPFALERLTHQRDQIRVTLAITTVDNQLRRALEPLAAPPRLRLKQLAELRRRGIATQVAIDPLIPGLTDTHENLEPLLDALAAEGVNHVTTSYMYLRRGIRDNLLKDLGPLDWAEPVLEAYQGGPSLAMGKVAAAKHLPRPYRQRGYALLMALAASRGITVSVCGLTNPDFRPPRLPRPRTESTFRQMILEYEQSRN